MMQLVPETEKPGPVPSRIERCLVDLPDLYGALYGSTVHGVGSAKIQALIARAEGLDAAIEADLRSASTLASKAQVGRELGMLVSSWPNASQGDLAGFSSQLGMQVMKARPSRYALGAACEHLKQTRHFVPSIAEVLEALAASETQLGRAVSAYQSMPSMVERARVVLADVQRRERSAEERERRQREEQDATIARRIEKGKDW